MRKVGEGQLSECSRRNKTSETVTRQGSTQLFFFFFSQLQRCPLVYRLKTEVSDCRMQNTCACLSTEVACLIK